jgi:hypothetical protein
MRLDLRGFYRPGPKNRAKEVKPIHPKLRKNTMKSIYKKILAVQQEAETVPKSGWNGFNKYAYATEADVLKVKELLNKHGLIAFPSTERFETLNRGDSVQVLMHIKYTVVDVESGESIECYVLGQGEDKGDKGAYKAATGANKYFYLKFAGCATGDDPERDEASKPETKPAPAKKPAKPAMDKKVSDLANLIVEACKLACLTPEQVREITDLPSIKETAEKGDAAALAQAWNKVQVYLQKKGAA